MRGCPSLPQGGEPFPARGIQPHPAGAAARRLLRPPPHPLGKPCRPQRRYRSDSLRNVPWMRRRWLPKRIVWLRNTACRHRAAVWWYCPGTMTGMIFPLLRIGKRRPPCCSRPRSHTCRGQKLTQAPPWGRHGSSAGSRQRERSRAEGRRTGRSVTSRTRRCAHTGGKSCSRTGGCFFRICRTPRRRGGKRDCPARSVPCGRGPLSCTVFRDRHGAA